MSPLLFHTCPPSSQTPHVYMLMVGVSNILSLHSRTIVVSIGHESWSDISWMCSLKTRVHVCMRFHVNPTPSVHSLRPYTLPTPWHMPRICLVNKCTSHSEQQTTFAFHICFLTCLDPALLFTAGTRRLLILAT